MSMLRSPAIQLETQFSPVTTQDVDVSSTITSIGYRCPIHEMNGHVEYATCPITDEEDVWCMFNTFENM